MTISTVATMISLPAAGVVDKAFSNDVIQMFVHAGLVVKIVLLILVLFSVASWAIIFTKYRFFKNAGYETTYFLDLFWDTNDLSKIYVESKELVFSPVAQLFRSGYSELMRMRKIQNPSADTNGDQGLNGLSEYVERALKKTTIHEAARMEKALSFLATTGNTAPFIGLFGTVWGIMESFRGIGLKGSASLAVVAPGISEALIATAVGLAAAIPAVVAFNYFNNKAAELRSEMDTFAADFLGLVVRQLLKKSRVTKQA